MGINSPHYSFRLFLFISLFEGINSVPKSNFNGPGHPVILVPGDAGSQMEALLDHKPTTVHYFCRRTTSEYFDLWLNLESLAPIAIDCFVDNIKYYHIVQYNNSTRTTSNMPGVHTRIQGWGNTSTVEYLDPSESRIGYYYNAITQMAVNHGYKRGKDIRGAPFDFRKAPNEAGQFFIDLKTLIEQTYYANHNKRVVTIGHSMGNPYLLYFYNHQTQAWKDKFIRAFISISAPWGGSVKVTELFASGYNMEHYQLLLPPLKLRPFQRSMPSSAWLLPSTKFWKKDEPLVITPDKNYTAYDYDQFFKDIQYDDGWQMLQDTQQLTHDMTPPGVEVHCLHGVDVPTPAQFVYGKGEFPDSQPSNIPEDGDGTVNHRSLVGCMRWNSSGHPVYRKEFPKEEHLEILQSPDVSKYIAGVIMGNDTQ